MVSSRRPAMKDAEENGGNKAVIGRLPALLARPDEAIVRALFTEDFRLHDIKFPDWPRGHAGALRMFTQMKTAIPDIQAVIEDMFGEGDKLCVRWRFKGRVADRAGDDARFEAIVISIYRFEQGRIAEDWGADMALPAGHPWRTN
jgi:predicted ester cyclase